MTSLIAEVRAHLEHRTREAEQARQRAALQLACAIDMEEALACDRGARSALSGRIRRAIERERLKGAQRHWSYDLNRHIALKQALDRLTEEGPAARRVGKPPCAHRRLRGRRCETTVTGGRP